MHRVGIRRDGREPADLRPIAFTRDFTEFAGYPPSRWLREEFRNVQAAAAGAVPDSPA